MKHKAVRSYRIPKYPSIELYIEHPELLLDQVPKRWLKQGITAGALLAFAGGGSSELTAVPSQNQPFMVQTQEHGISQAQEAKKEKSKIAPIFIYGDGVGSTGCVAMNPPVFISESEALNLILAELKKAELPFFDEFDHTVPGMNMNWKDIRFGIQQTEKGIQETVITLPFSYDVYSSKYNFGIKFISRENYNKLSEKSWLGTSFHYNMIETSQILKEKIEKQSDSGAAIFYDPLKQDIENTRQELLKQVEDFIVWFKREIVRDVSGNEL